MNNVKTTIDKHILTIEVDLTKDFGPSASGKTIQIASTLGNKPIGDGISFGLNVYRKNQG